MSLGRKIRDAMRKQRWKIVGRVRGHHHARPDLAQSGGDRAQNVTALYESGEVDAVYIVFNEFKSVLAQNLTLEKLLPIEPDPAQRGRQAPSRGVTRESITSTSSRRPNILGASAAALRASADFPGAG